MEAETAVKNGEIPEPQEGGDERRERSTILFPYGDLDSGIKVAKAVHRVGGTNCQMETLAAELKLKATAGGFRLMIYTAKIFGLVTYGQGTIQLTTLGQQITDQKQEKLARVTAFLLVPLYKQIYEKFKAGTLPQQATALESEMLNLGVAKKQTDKARQSFQRSAQQAGFFAYGQDRLVMPATGPGEPAPPPKDPEPDPNAGRQHREDGGGSGGGRHPFIAGLLKELPAEGAEWTTDERRKWLQAAAMIFDIIYKNGGSGTSLKIEVEKTSAK